MKHEPKRSQHDRESDQGYDERCHGDIFKKADPDRRIPKESGLMKDSSTLMERLKRLKYPVEEA